MELKVLIYKPDDSQDYYTTTIQSNLLKYTSLRLDARKSLSIRRASANSKDPLHEGIKNQFKQIFAKKRDTRYYNNLGIPTDISDTFNIRGLTIFIEKKAGRHYINGVYLSLANMCDVLARVLYRSCFEEDVSALNKTLWKYLQVPENINYVLENRVPYFFYEDYERHDVRLNVQRIGQSQCAIEIGDGLWGEISFSDLDKYCNFYVHGNKRGSWPYTSPKNLFKKLLNREPSTAELRLMIAFLQQNRKQDIIEKRAYELINEMVEQNPERLFPIWNDENQLSTLIVRGRDYDWKLTCRNYKSTGTQDVSTYVYQPTSSDKEVEWRGPICIDNANNDSSIGDQFAARAMALLNDHFTIQIVSTIKSYIRGEPNENRVDINEEMRRMRDN
jgi:hypothetical protein